MKTKSFHKIKYELKGHKRLSTNLYFYFLFFQCGKDTVNDTVLEWYPFYNKTKLNNTPGELIINNTGTLKMLYQGSNEKSKINKISSVLLNSKYFFFDQLP